MTDEITLAVQRDLEARAEVGLKKYGVPLGESTLPLRAWLRHAYEECLDQACYLKRAMVEMDRKP